MRLIPAFVVFIVLFPIGYSGCKVGCRNTPGANKYREIVDTITSSNTVAVKIFSELPVDEQMTVFLYARNCPDDSRIRGMFMLDGEKKIPAIVERIKKEKQLWDKGELVGILIPINTKCRCISKDSEIILALEAIGKELDEDKTIPSDYAYKQMYKRSVETLKHQLDAN